jgi:SAM-dependent methyltransferase
MSGEPMTRSEALSRDGAIAWRDFAAEFDPDALPRLHAANRYAGGARSLLRPLRRIVEPGRPIRVLDVATGGADIPRALATWARQQGIPISLVGVELHPRAAAQAAADSRSFPEIHIVRADAWHLPYRPGAFDVITCAMFLHYFPAPRAVALLRALAALQPRVMLISDVMRHWLPPLAMRLLAQVSRSPLFGPESRHTVSLGFTVQELAALARQIGFRGWRVERTFPFRVCLIGFPGAGS